MNKPQGYDEAQAFGEFETLPAGGYKCKILKVECNTSTNGKEYLKIGFDIAEGKYKDFYRKKFDNDTRGVEEREWGGIWVVFTEGYEPNTTNSTFKGLITSVEASNPNFKFNFDEKTLVNKKVGLVFREEEFEGMFGETKSATKPFYAVSYDKAEEAKVPKPKTLPEKSDISFETDFASNNDDLPF